MIKKGIAVIVTILLIVSQFNICVMADSVNLNPPGIGSASAILMDAQTGEILYAKNAHTKRFPASITKVMTCLLALEKALGEESGDGLSTVVTADKDTLNIEAGSSNAGMKMGEELTVEQLLYFAMVVSGNDAANGLGQYVSNGDLSAFSQLMTQRAAELGCKNTFFWNAHGLNEAPESQDKHMTTAYDMALIMKQAVTIPMFVQLMSTSYYEAPPTNKTAKTRKYTNSNKMILQRENAYYEYCIGGKTGWTTPAGNTLVTYAEKNDRKLICVVLKANGRNMAYADTKALYEYGFSDDNFQVVTLESVFAGQETTKTVSVTENGKIVGTAEVYVDLAQSFYMPAGGDVQQIQKQLVCPDVIEKGTDIEASVTITMPESWQKSGFVLEPVSLDAIVGEVAYLPTNTPTSEHPGTNKPIKNDDQIVNDQESDVAGTVLFAVFMIIIVMVLLVIIRRYIVWKRRRKKKYWWKEHL